MCATNGPACQQLIACSTVFRHYDSHSVICSYVWHAGNRFDAAVPYSMPDAHDSHQRMQVRAFTRSVIPCAGFCRGSVRKDFRPPGTPAVQQANDMLRRVLWLLKGTRKRVESPDGGAGTESQPAAEAGVPPDDAARDIDEVAQQFLRRAAACILGTAQPPPAPAPPQPEPDATHAQVPQRGGRQSGPLLTSKEVSREHSADLDAEGQEPTSCAEVAVAASSSSHISANTATAHAVGAAGSDRPANGVAATAPLNGNVEADVAAVDSSLRESLEDLSCRQSQFAAEVLPSQSTLLPGSQQQHPAPMLAAPAASSEEDSAVGGPEAGVLLPPARAPPAQQPAPPANAAQQQLASPQIVREAGRMHLAYGPRASGLPAEDAARVVALECLLLLFVVRRTPHAALMQLNCSICTASSVRPRQLYFVGRHACLSGCTGHTDSFDDSMTRTHLMFCMVSRVALRSQVCVNTVLPTAPLATGDAVLALVGLSARHDLYAAILGIIVLWSAGLLLRQVYRLPQVDTFVGSNSCLHCCRLSLGSCGASNSRRVRRCSSALFILFTC